MTPTYLLLRWKSVDYFFIAASICQSTSARGHIDATSRTCIIFSFRPSATFSRSICPTFPWARSAASARARALSARALFADSDRSVGAAPVALEDGPASKSSNRLTSWEDWAESACYHGNKYRSIAEGYVACSKGRFCPLLSS